MKKIYEVSCTGWDDQGQGVFQIGKKTYALKNLIPHEKARVSIDEKSRVQLEQITHPSQYRHPIACSHFLNCGGCALLHLNSKGQQTFKTEQVKKTFAPLKALFQTPIPNCQMAKDPWYYRNKVQMPVVPGKRGVLIGLYEKGSIQVIEKDDCLIQNKLTTLVLSVLRKLISKYHISGFNWQTHKGQLKYILLRYGFTTNELMLVLVTNGPTFKYYREWTRELTKAIPQLVTIVQNINTRKDHLVLDRQQKIWYGKGYIADYIGDIKFLISPHSFYQINPPQVKRLYDCVKDYAKLTGKETIIDAYCGVGTIGLYLAKAAKKVYGVELVSQAIEDARKNAKINHIQNAVFQVGDAGAFMVKMAKAKQSIDVVIVDPPRAGCTPDLLQAVLKLQPSRFIYVSCQIETQARDLAYFKNSGYQITATQSFDLFPQTHHIENVILLEKSGKNMPNTKKADQFKSIPSVNV